MKQIAFVTAMAVAALTGRAQSQPWVEFDDDVTDTSCGLINVTNAELVLLESGELVVVSDLDTELDDRFSVEGDTVFFEGEEFGFIGFFEDADGVATLWWISPDGDVVELEEDDVPQSSGGVLPEDFAEVGCDPCDGFWDDESDCAGPPCEDRDGDGDGVDDCDDQCADTPDGEEVDDQGCLVCESEDGDDDGVNDCDDLCPETEQGEEVDGDGCTCAELDGDQDEISDCDDLCPETPAGGAVDATGCACSERDTDRDGVNDCADQCRATPPGDDVGNNGCSVGRPDNGGGGGGGGGSVGCGASGAPILAVTLFLMGGLRLFRRQRGA